jgi:hypothetical protein
MTVIDGRAGIVEEIATAPAALRGYIVSSFRRINQDSEFKEALPGYLPSDDASQRRSPLLRKKIEAIITLPGGPSALSD